MVDTSSLRTTRPACTSPSGIQDILNRRTGGEVFSVETREVLGVSHHAQDVTAAASIYRRGQDPHAEAVRRIKAAHSRYRIRSHPRSQYNSPPHPYDYWGC